MKLPVLIILVLYSIVGLAEEKMGLEHLMLVVGKQSSSQGTPNLYVFSSKDEIFKQKYLTFEELIVARDSKNLELITDVKTPLFRFKKEKLPHVERMYIKGEDLFVRHIIEKSKGEISSKIARIGRWASFSATIDDKMYENFRIYELIFEKGIQFKKFNQGEISEREEILLELMDLIKNQEKARKLQELREKVIFNNSRRATLKEIINLKLKYPGLKPSINELLKILEIQLSKNHYSKTDSVKLLKDVRVTLYTMAKKSDSLFYRSADDIGKDWSYTLSKKSQDLYSSEHASDRLNNLMILFFDTIYRLDQARKKGDFYKVDQLSIESIRLFSEVYIIAGLTKGSIGLEKIYSGIISTVGAIGLSISSILTNNSELKIAFAISAAGLFTHALIKLYEKEKMYKESQLVFPGVKKIVQYKNSKNLRQHVIDLSYEIGLYNNPQVLKQQSKWFKYAIQNQILGSEFINKVAKIIELASGKGIESAMDSFNEYYSCKQMF